jgi:hypothetical protein
MDCHFKQLPVLATDTAEHTVLQNVYNKCPFKVQIETHFQPTTALYRNMSNISVLQYICTETCQTSVYCSTSVQKHVKHQCTAVHLYRNMSNISVLQYICTETCQTSVYCSTSVQKRVKHQCTAVDLYRNVSNISVLQYICTETCQTSVYCSTSEKWRDKQRSTEEQR